MSGICKVILVGNVGSDIEVKHSQSGQSIVPLSIATSESWTDKTTGQKQEKTEWHRVVMFGKLAEIAGQYLHKGSKVYIEGKLQTRKWQDNNGNDKYTTEVVVSGFNGVLQMLDKKGETSQEYDQQPTKQSDQQPTKQTDEVPTIEGAVPGVDEFFEDDIPF